MYWNDLDRHVGGACMDEIWLANPLVREAVNVRITGDAGRWPLDWFQQELADRLPLARAVSVGCGAGALERDLVSRGICLKVTGIDVAEAPLAKARADAIAAGLTGQISYVLADGYEYLATHEGLLDAVFFHASLHHFDRLDDLLRRVRLALKPGGLLYIDEYVGPSRHQWNPLRLLLPNLAYYALPRAARRVGVVRAPVNREDATEAVASSEIVPAIARWLEIREQRDYGGNLLSLIYPSLNRSGSRRGPSSPAALQTAVRRLLGWESGLLALGARSYFTVLVAERT
jgi:SAM-dependent methyltransferase